MVSSGRSWKWTAVRVLVRAGVSVIILIVGLGVYGLLVATRPLTEHVERVERPLAVRIMTVAPVELPRSFEGFGTARALRTSEVAAELSGVVVEREPGLQGGVQVRRGDVLVALDAREFRERLDRIERLIAAHESDLAAMDVEQESLDEQVKLAEEAVEVTRWEIAQLSSAETGGGASRVEIERLRRQLTVALREALALRQQQELLPSRRARVEALISAERASARGAQLDLERTRIRAPIDGVLQSMNIEVGEHVTPGRVVARIVDLRTIEVPLRVPVSAASDLSVGVPAELLPSGPGAERWVGRVSRIAPEADPATRTMTLFVEVEQEVGEGGAALLIPGRFVRAVVYSTNRVARLVVPRGSVNGDRVMVVDAEDRARSRQVEILFHAQGRFSGLDERETEWAAIGEGLEVGERVVVSNLDEVIPGMLVESALGGAAGGGAGASVAPVRAGESP